MRYTYTADDAAAVRRMVNAALTPAMLPDEAIIGEHLTGAAEDWAFGILTPEIEAQLTVEQEETVFRAVLNYLASMLIAETPVVTGGSIGQARYTVAGGDVQRRAERLEAQASRVLHGIRQALQPVPVRRLPTAFRVAGGRRGR